MSLNHRPPSLETRPLLSQRSSCYHSTDDVNSRTRVPTDTTESTQPVNRRIDLAWILAGLWSGVLLGAFDGKHSDRFSEMAMCLTSRKNRDCRGNPTNTDRERIQRFT